MKILSNFLTCWNLKQKSICIRLAVCQYRPSFQAPPVLGKLNWQFSILFRSEGHVADSRKNKKGKQENTQIRQAGDGVQGPGLQRCGPTALSDGGLKRPPCPAPCFQKGQIQRGPSSCEVQLCLQITGRELPLDADSETPSCNNYCQPLVGTFTAWSGCYTL